MQQKLIITLWKAQFKEINKQHSVYCRITYNNQERNSKQSNQEKNMAWKETFLFTLGKKELPLKLEFISLKNGQEIHFAKDNVAQSLSFGKATVEIAVQTVQKGTLPCKMDILNKHDEVIGKIFIQYEILKTQVAYTVQKQMDYLYLLKMSNFKVNFIRNLKKTPKFYLLFTFQGRQHRQDLPFELDMNNEFVYNYPVKLYLKKQLQMQIQLIVKDQQEYQVELNDNRTQTSFTQSMTTQKKTSKSSIGKKDKILLELGKEKIAGIMDLNFKKDSKVYRKIPLTTIVKFQKREIGVIQFQAEAIFRSKEELKSLQEQKKGINPEIDPKLQRKKSIVKQSNGTITVNSILGRLQLFNDSIISNKNMSLELKLGMSSQQSTILQRPGKQLIIIDTFNFKRTWQETLKIIINMHSNTGQKIPTFFADVNLRQLFEIGRYVSKKAKIRDENKNYSGELTLDMVYKQQQQKKSPNISLKESMISISEMPQKQLQQLRSKSKREQIEDRMKRRQQNKVKSKQIYSMSTLAMLEQNDIILPPLKSISRMQTLSPKNQKYRNALLNVNGNVKFSKARRFQSAERQGYQSYTYVKQSDFNKKTKGPYIGYGQKSDFTKPVALNPGVGRYQIPTVWDKYK